MVTRKEVEKVIVEKFGAVERVDYKEKPFSASGDIPLSLYYVKGLHVGTYNHKTKDGWYFDSVTRKAIHI